MDEKIENSEALESIKAGAHIQACGVYLCPQCREIVTNAACFLIENIPSQVGVSHYKIAFPFGEPKCDNCGGELEYIQNVLSSKVKCPRCGNKLKSKKKGTF